MKVTAAAILALPLAALGSAPLAQRPEGLPGDLPLTCQSVLVDAGTLRATVSAVQPSFDRLPKHTAAACFQDGLFVSGWGQLQVATASAPPPSASSPERRADLGAEELLAEWYGAGLIEGLLTGHRIADGFTNTYQTLFKTNASGPLPSHIARFFRQQRRFAAKLAAKAGPRQLQLRALLAQLSGLVEGLESWRKAHPEKENLFGGASSLEVATLISALGDMLDILNFVKGEQAVPSLKEESLEELKERLARRGLCSALFRALPDLSDIVMGHTSWYQFANTNRVFKHYSLPALPFKGAAVARPVTMSFSSYAGMLVSLDDFYMMSTGLVMIQTSLGVVDQTVYNESTAEALLAWQRVRLANAMASTGEEWAELIKEDNSGTYNNEYMVLNLNLFKKGEPLPDKLLTVVNQVPGLVAHEDATQALRFGYFPSYNVPYVRAAFVKAGYQAAFEKYGDPELTYDLAPRATVFRRDALRAVSVDSLKQVLGSNDYLHDPLAKGDPTKQVCARADLPGVGAAVNRTVEVWGCYDLKVTSATLARSLKAEALNGPTRGGGADGSHHEELPPFSWDESPQARAAPHVGLPSNYTFHFIDVSPWLLTKQAAEPVAENSLVV